MSSEPKTKKKQPDNRPESTGKAYERLVEDLFMGDSEDDDEPTVEDDDETE